MQMSAWVSLSVATHRPPNAITQTSGAFPVHDIIYDCMMPVHDLAGYEVAPIAQWIRSWTSDLEVGSSIPTAGRVTGKSITSLCGVPLPEIPQGLQPAEHPPVWHSKV